MLPFAAFLLFAILGIAALNVDMGLAFGAKAHLETTAETLALERARLNAGAGGPDVDEQAALQDLLDSMVSASPFDPSAATTRNKPLPIGAPVLGANGEVGLSQRMPLLFGMAAVPIQGEGPLDLAALRQARQNGNGLLPGGGIRGTGLAPGARAYARPRPALRVGFPQTDASGALTPGLADIALDLRATAQVAGSLYVDTATGALHRIDSSGPIVGRVIAHPRNGECQGAACPGLRVGDTFPTDPPSGVFPQVVGDVYIPLYDDYCGNQVVGYFAANLTSNGTDLGFAPALTQTVYENASAIPDAAAFAAPPCATPLQISNVLAITNVSLLQVASLAPEAP